MVRQMVLQKVDQMVADSGSHSVYKLVDQKACLTGLWTVVQTAHHSVSEKVDQSVDQSVLEKVDQMAVHLAAHLAHQLGH